MEHPTPTLLRENETRLVSLCEDHLVAEESLLTDLLHSLRQVRDAFFQRNLKILPTLQARQEELTKQAMAMAAARDQLRNALAELLGVSPREVTLREAAGTLQEPARSRLLARHARLCKLVRETGQLSQQNAALLGYARSFFASLFADLFGAKLSERYGPQGERSDGTIGFLLEARA